LLADDGIAPEVRAEAANALLALKPDPTLKALAALIGDNAISPALRSRIGAAMTDRDADKTARILADALTLAPGPVQLRLAGTLAGSQAGARQLLDLIGGGKASPQLLLDRALAARLKAVDKASEQRITKLSAGLQPLDKKLEALIAAASKAYAPGKAWLPSGENLFKQNCAACHSLGGEGGKVGPQLDGIGGRGSHRILEDLLDPNRNLDPAFHAENIDLKDDTVITGLPLREEGQLLIVVDTTGKEIQIRKSDIVSRQKSALSLMPGNFGDVLKPEQINHLVAYLMSK
jgi:putative heme-binding domain-containing protein